MSVENENDPSHAYGDSELSPGDTVPADMSDARMPGPPDAVGRLAESVPPAGIPITRARQQPSDADFLPPQVATEQSAVPADPGETVSRNILGQMKRRRRKQLMICLLLFLLTFISTSLVGSGGALLNVLLIMAFGGMLDPPVGPLPPGILATAIRAGLEYSVPLMTILLCHEMGHYLQSVRHRVPASLPYFIPFPFPPLGTMGAVIFQGRGAADRRQMFDIAVSGPLAGLAVTIPILWYGIGQSEFVAASELQGPAMMLGEPLLLQWMIRMQHGVTPDGYDFALNGVAMAGWVGVFVTAMNLLPIGQLDGGHIVYTLLGRKAHWVAIAAMLIGAAMMVFTGQPSYILLFILLMLTGLRHPPTANDRIPLGVKRTVIGWLTMCFLIIGFTPRPLYIEDPDAGQEPVPEEEARPEDVPDPLQYASNSLTGMPEYDAAFNYNLLATVSTATFDGLRSPSERGASGMRCFSGDTSVG